MIIRINMLKNMMQWRWQLRWWSSQVPKRMWEWDEGVWVGDARIGWGSL